MRWLPRLLSHAAAAGRIPATSHGFATGGNGRGSRGGAPGAGAAAEVVVRSEEPDAAKRPGRPAPGAVADAVVRSEELKRRPDAAKTTRRPAVTEPVVRSEDPKKRRRDAAAAKRPRRQRAVPGGGGVSLRGLADAARSFVNSKVAALGGSFAGAWRAAGKEGKAQSTSYRHGDELDLARVQAKLKPLLSRGILTITRQVEWAHILLGFQKKARYIIKDPCTPRRKTPVALIREKSNFIIRQLHRSRRPFVAEFTDHKGNEIFTLHLCRSGWQGDRAGPDISGAWGETKILGPLYNIRRGQLVMRRGIGDLLWWRILDFGAGPLPWLMRMTM